MSSDVFVSVSDTSVSDVFIISFSDTTIFEDASDRFEDASDRFKDALDRFSISTCLSASSSFLYSINNFSTQHQHQYQLWLNFSPMGLTITGFVSNIRRAINKTSNFRGSLYTSSIF